MTYEPEVFLCDFDRPPRRSPVDKRLDEIVREQARMAASLETLSKVLELLVTYISERRKTDSCSVCSSYCLMRTLN